MISPPGHPLRLLLASAEVYPFSKTGGLADMVSALAKALARAGHEVSVVTPLYRGVRERWQGLEPLAMPLEVPLDDRLMSGTIWTRTVRPGYTIYFVDQPGYFQRARLYDQGGVEYPDNCERFVFLSKCVIDLARRLPHPPQVLHVHDWHVGLVPLLVRDLERRGDWPDAPATCLTIHNLAFQGVYPASLYRLTNLPLDYFHPDGAEFHGAFNLLKAGLAFADLITTVSPKYAEEIMTPEFGCGLDGLLRARAHVLRGILNGVDYEEWRTVDNPFLPSSYDASDLAGKAANKRALQAEMGLPERPDVPLFGVVSRLTPQKGVDLTLGALEELLPRDLQFVLLGSGLPELETAMLDLARRHPDKVAVRIGYDNGLAHRIEAGCDFFLMPSQFEPSGLNQMYSLRYGTIPIVRATGGLENSVIDIREDADYANGIKFHEPNPAALVKAIRKALTLYAEPELLERYRWNAMHADFSWDFTAQEYLALYRALLPQAASEAGVSAEEPDPLLLPRVPAPTPVEAVQMSA